MDLSFVIALAAVAWLEGVRHLDDQTVVLRQVGFGPWRADSATRRSRLFQVVSVWPPLTLGVRVAISASPPARGTLSVRRRARARVQRIRAHVISVRIASMLTFAALILGVPYATSRFGLFGLSSSLGVLLALSATCTALTFAALRSLHASPREATRAALPALSPFGALRSAEIILEHALSGSPAFVAAQAVMTPAAFARWVRSYAYDAVRASAGQSEPALIGDLTMAFGRRELAGLVDAPPAELPMHAVYCPRCGQTYRTGISACRDCGDLALSTCWKNPTDRFALSHT